MGLFVFWVVTVVGTLTGINQLNAREARAAERETGARCAVVFETAEPNDVLPFLEAGETLRKPLYWFGGHQIACVPRGPGDRTRLREIRRAAEEKWARDMCRYLREYCGK